MKNFKEYYEQVNEQVNEKRVSKSDLSYADDIIMSQVKFKNILKEIDNSLYNDFSKLMKEWIKNVDIITKKAEKLL